MTISASTVTGSFAWIDVYPTSPITLTPGTTYWLKLVASGTSATNYYTVGTNNNIYSGGQLKTKAGAGSWTLPSPTTTDEYFSMYAGNASTISGMDITGSARAYTVNSSNVTGALYCQAGSGNNKSCDSSQLPPTTASFPISDANIDEWITDASAGGVRNSSLSLSGSTASSTTGALKINGSLTLSNNAVLTLNGPLYVTGTINISNDGIIKLGSSYGSGSGYIIVDGTTTTSNDGQFQGSGYSGSYIMIASKSGNINISNKGGSVVLVTLNGTIDFSNFATAKAASGYRMTMSNHTTLNYESGLTNIDFSSGPSGAWSIDSWGEVE
jgi:hypothetical protein